MGNKEEHIMSEQVLGDLREAILELDAKKSEEIALKGITQGVDPLEMINKSIRAALDILGDRFSAGDLFLPELMLAAKAAALVGFSSRRLKTTSMTLAKI